MNNHAAIHRTICLRTLIPPRRVTAVAGCTVVRVSADAGVFAVHDCLVVCVAVDATEYGIVGGIGMTVIARSPFPGVTATVDRELVSNLGSNPHRRGVASLASFRESRSDVIRIGHTAEFLAVTRETVGGRSGIAAANMAIRAHHRRMRTR